MSRSEGGEPAGSSCVFMKTVQVRDGLTPFETELDLPNPKGQHLTQTAQPVSMRSNLSKMDNPDFSAETPSLDTKSFCSESMKSDLSKMDNPDFSTEAGATDTRKRRIGVCDEELLSCCSLCQDLLKDPVSTSCGHWFCRQCITSYWNQSDASGLCSCPQCVETSRTREGLQTFRKNRTVHGLVVHLPLMKMRRSEGGEPAGSSCVFMKVRDGLEPFKTDLDLPNPKKRKIGVCEEELLSCCSLCQDVVKDPVSTSCGHWFCRRCITSYWDQSDPSGLCSCPQCGEQSRSRVGLQTISQNRTVQGFTQEKYTKKYHFHGGSDGPSDEAVAVYL
ncbi:E3 ubiquitin-protein ligase TRIM62 [Oryzias melastigma]|uniref:E3 ubiquitin-protein ligase TRIM62 n=1 Tax=Oryzias melastigma TaxID=30732 RepID=A0A834F5N4_ORYME|nr:E3 ubiquitin-protein ligase TRIM62 [Oryzias melastigma]